MVVMMTEEEFMDAQDAYGMDVSIANIGAEAIHGNAGK
jgi:DNA-directed RNA polymerase subunit beta'